MNTTIDPVEREKFSKMAEEWWDPSGKFKALHKFNPKRIEFIRNKIIDHFSIEPNAENPFSNLDILDIGCGGGLLSNQCRDWEEMFQELILLKEISM